MAGPMADGSDALSAFEARAEIRGRARALPPDISHPALWSNQGCRLFGLFSFWLRGLNELLLLEGVDPRAGRTRRPAVAPDRAGYVLCMWPCGE